MILLTKNTKGRVVCTLEERRLQKETAPVYKFEFKHILTGKIITVLIDSTTDRSFYPDRYNEFDFPQEPFADAPQGFYTYQVFEMINETGLAQMDAIEAGRMFLKDDAAHNTTTYRPDYKPITVYNG